MLRRKNVTYAQGKDAIKQNTISILLPKLKNKAVGVK
jgi:hypothetical protein